MFEFIYFTCIFGIPAFLLFVVAVITVKDSEIPKTQGPAVRAGGNQYMGYQGQEEVNPWTYAPIYGTVGDWWEQDWEDDYPEESYYDV